MSIALTEEHKYDEAYYLLKDGLQLRLKEDPQIDPLNDFQLHQLYLLQRFITYDNSPDAVELRSLVKNYIRNAVDDETKVI